MKSIKDAISRGKRKYQLAQRAKINEDAKKKADEALKREAVEAKQRLLVKSWIKKVLPQLIEAWIAEGKVSILYQPRYSNKEMRLPEGFFGDSGSGVLLEELKKIGFLILSEYYEADPGVPTEGYYGHSAGWDYRISWGKADDE